MIETINKELYKKYIVRIELKMKFINILKRHFTDFIYKDNPDGPFYFLSPLLSLVSLFYAVILKVRFLLYRVGVLNTRRLNIMVISVGNITIGGTGKTPAVEMIVRTLISRNLKTAVLSRGYKGKSTGMVNVISNFNNMLMGPYMAGDEPYMLAERLKGVPVITGKNRYITGSYAENRLGVDAVVLDDGYQHIQLKRDLNILLIDSRIVFGNGHLFPRGILRESIDNINRADAIIFTKCKNSFNSDPFKKKYVKKNIPIFKSCYVPTECTEICSGRKESPDYLKGKRILAFCAIGTPISFKDTIEELGANVTVFLEYPDHYNFTEDDLALIRQNGCLHNIEIFLTTEKDSVKLTDHPYLSFPIWELKIEMKIIDRIDEWNKIIQERMTVDIAAYH